MRQFKSYVDFMKSKDDVSKILDYENLVLGVELIKNHPEYHSLNENIVSWLDSLVQDMY